MEKSNLDIIIDNKKYKVELTGQPVNNEKIVETMVNSLAELGFQTEYKITNKNPAKARHKWTKEVSKTSFFVDYNESSAVIQWPKRNRMIVKKGAILKSEPNLNMDGTLGFSARLSQKIRDDNSENISNFKTTSDIELKSVNEVGMFLYFGDTNGWLVLKDKSGKTIDEYSKV